MDLVTVTVPELGCARRPLRVTAIREDENGVLEMDAEEFPWGTASPTLYPHQSAAGFVPQSNADPGSVNAPMLFEANDRLSRSGGYEIWMGVSGAGPDWGGCSVWVSADNAAYKQIGRVFGPARMGALSSALASAADPDTTHTLSVDLTQSLGELGSGAAADCDNFRTLCWVDGELISYQTAILTALHKYDLGTRLRRGVFGSPVSAHAGGAQFLRLDEAVFAWQADPTLVGTTIYFKFTSFNRFDLQEQSLANATAYSFSFAGSFGNGGYLTNNATIDSVVDGASADIRIYGPGGPGTGFTAWKQDGTTRSLPAATLTTIADAGSAPAFSTAYRVSYDFASGAYNAWINYNNWIQAIGHGQMPVGSVVTVSSGGTGGSIGGGGDSGDGGSKGNDPVIP